MSALPQHLSELPQVGGSHPRVKQYLNIKRNRGPSPGVMTLEGTWALRAALDNGIGVELALVCPALLRGDTSDGLIRTLRGRGAPVVQVSAKVFGRLADREGPDGVAAIVRFATASLDGIEVGARTRLVVADRFELAGNLGTLIRAADGAGATAVLVTDRRLRVTHPLVVKASMGTLFSTPIVDVSGEAARAWLAAKGVRVVVADPGGPASYRDADLRGPVALVLGSERYGIDHAWRTAADLLVSIPMLGQADSLNVGHAAALLLYEAMHQNASRRPR